MGFTGAHVLHTFDAFILALYLLSHGCALLKYKNPTFLAPHHASEISHKNQNFPLGRGSRMNFLKKIPRGAFASAILPPSATNLLRTHHVPVCLCLL